MTRVTSSPTKAALQPGWPESLFTLCLVFLPVLKLPTPFDPADKSIPWLFAIPALASLSWIASFGIVEHSKNTAGWISATIWVTSFSVALSNLQRDSILATFICIALLQWILSLVVIIQRWIGSIGSVVYEISDNFGCTPVGGDFSYLQGGARSRAFRIVQTVCWVWMTYVMWMVWMSANHRMKRDPNNRSDYFEVGALSGWPASPNVVKLFIAATTLWIVIPAMIYEIVIATLGRPVVVSGNCMLVEADPKFGFLDMDVEAYWKVLVGLTGL